MINTIATTTYLLVMLAGAEGQEPMAFMHTDISTKQIIHYPSKASCRNAGITLQTHRHHGMTYEFNDCIAVERLEVVE